MTDYNDQNDNIDSMTSSDEVTSVEVEAGDIEAGNQADSEVSDVNIAEEVASESSDNDSSVSDEEIVDADSEVAVSAGAAQDSKAVADSEDQGKVKKNSARREDLPWYVVHTYSGFEGRVKQTMEERIRSKGFADKFGDIVIPEETVVELKKGVKKTSTKKFLPGYILVQVDLNEDTWALVNNVPKVTGFVGDSRNPAPLSTAEVQSLLNVGEAGATRSRPKTSFEVGDSVKVTEGPFAEFNGTVEEVKPEKGKLKVSISIFGRNTPVELDFVQVEKV